MRHTTVHPPLLFRDIAAGRASTLEAGELTWFFAGEAAAAMGLRSTFGLMCERIAEMRPPKDENGCLSVVRAHSDRHVDSFAEEESMHRRLACVARWRRTAEVLEHVPAKHARALAAVFGSDRVPGALVQRFGAELGALVHLTSAAKAAHRSSVAKGNGATGRGVGPWLASKAFADRPEHRALFAAARREAEAMLCDALDAYRAAKGKRPDTCFL